MRMHKQIDFFMEMNLIESMIFPVPKASYSMETFGISGLKFNSDLKDHNDWQSQAEGCCSQRTSEFLTDIIPVINFYNPKFKYTLLYFHGNGEDIGHVIQIGNIILNQGFNFFCPEFPGYGCYSGTPSEQGFYNVAEYCLQYLLNNKRKVIVVGRSIGTGPASELGSKFSNQIETLVLISPFKSISDMAIEKFPILGNIVPQRFDNLKKISQVTCPLLLLHGKLDNMVPSDHSVKLLKKCKTTKKKLYLIDGRDHNNLLDSNVIRKSLEFLKTWLH